MLKELRRAPEQGASQLPTLSVSDDDELEPLGLAPLPSKDSYFKAFGPKDPVI